RRYGWNEYLASPALSSVSTCARRRLRREPERRPLWVIRRHYRVIGASPVYPQETDITDLMSRMPAHRALRNERSRASSPRRPKSWRRFLSSAKARGLRL